MKRMKKVRTGRMNELQLRQSIVSIFEGWLGLKESDGSHMKIVDIYNDNKPLARGYKVRQKDAWCAVAGSAAAIEAGLTDIIPTECGCGEQIKLWQQMGRWQEKDDYVPQTGDYIYYDWQDSGTGDNTGWPDHVGVVVSVSGNIIKVIEGNKNDAVGYREIAVNARYIRGYGLPDYAGKAAASAPETSQETVEEKREETYKMNTLKRGSKGNDVTIFESIMKKMGYYNGEIDTNFGPKCVAACNAFQTRYPECGTNGQPDNAFGPRCWAKALSLLK